MTARAGPSRVRLGGGHVVRQERRPAAVVPVAPGLAAGAQAGPAAMLDLHPRRSLGAGEEPDLDVRGVTPIGVEVPRVAEAGRRFPDRDLAPVVLLAAGPALEDAAAGPSLEHDRQPLLCRNRVVERPPLT